MNRDLIIRLLTAGDQWYPASLGSLYLGYEGTDQYAAGTWSDKSGNGRHATQATGGDRPTAGTLSGKGALVFDGVSQYLNLPNLSSLTAAEIFIQLAVNDDPPLGTGTTGLWHLTTSGEASHYRWVDTNVYDGAASTSRATVGGPASIPSLAARHVYSVTSTPGGWTARINDATEFTTGTNTVGLPAGPLLGRSDGGAYHLAGKVSAFLVYSAPLSPSNRTLLHAYLNS